MPATRALLNRLVKSVAEASPWAWIALASLVALSSIDWLREHTQLGTHMLVGVAPNFVGVFALTFSWMTARIPKKTSAADSPLPVFLQGWLGAVIGLIAWELVQKQGGQLIFDPNDLWATLVGGAAALLCFLLTRRAQGSPAE